MDTPSENGGCADGEREEVKKARELELEAIRAAEGGSLGNALESLSRAIAQAPEYASPYNNRAQVMDWVCYPTMLARWESASLAFTGWACRLRVLNNSNFTIGQPQYQI